MTEELCENCGAFLDGYKCPKCGWEKQLDPTAPDYKDQFKQRIAEEGSTILHLSAIENPELNKEIITVDGIISSSSLSYFTPRKAKAWNRDSEGEILEAQADIPLNSEDNAKFVGVSEGTKCNILRGIMRMPSKASIDILSNRLTYRVRLRPPVFRLRKEGDKILDEQGHEYKPQDIYIVSDTKLELSASTRIHVTGKSFPDPKNQKTTLLGIEATFPDNVKQYDRDRLQLLFYRFSTWTVKQRVEWILKHFELYSRIIGRKNLSYATLLGYFTPIYVSFNGDTQRGWGIIVIIGDTTSGKSATVDNAISLLNAGTLITAETASAVGLTGTATQADRGEWFVDWGFLPLNNEGLLAIDGAQKLSPSQHATCAEAERQGIVTKATAAKGSAPARTRQIKLFNPVDRDIKGYATKPISEFLRPIQGIPTVLDGTSIARVDLAVISDKRTVQAKEINQFIEDTHDPDLEILAEALRLAWSQSAAVTFTEEAIKHLLNEATRLSTKFYSKRVPLVDHNFKWKLARLSVALAQLTLSTDPEFTTVTVGKDHVTEIVRFLEQEYTEAGLSAQAKAEEYDRLDPEEAPELIELVEYVMGEGVERAVQLLKWIVDQGGATKAEIMTQFELTDNNQIRPLMATLSNLNLVNRSRGFTPSQKLIQLYKLLEADPEPILERVGVLISERGNRVKRGKDDPEQGVLP